MLCVDGHGSGWDNEGRNLAARDMAQLELEWLGINQSGCFFDDLSCSATANRLVVSDILVRFDGGWFMLNGYIWVATSTSRMTEMIV